MPIEGFEKKKIVFDDGYEIELDLLLDVEAGILFVGKASIVKDDDTKRELAIVRTGGLAD